MTMPLPKDFMRQRRPSQFSDSRIVTESKLNRTILEQQLDSLTSRKQEYDFEEFARELCQFEICPNLRPQTGPTGGGDGKVDTETTPTSKQISDVYYHGVEKNADERWAFAFSATKQWERKVKDDVKKIAETNRGYSRIFFITNQYAKASTRAQLEDDLSLEHKIPVTIHDRTWLLDKVFENKREKLAIEKLNLGEGLEEKKDIGPNDYQRQKLFEELNKSIEEANVKDEITINTIDNCLDTALLAAELDKPRTEVDGLFERAIRFAKKHGTRDQYFTVIYQRTWTLYFWFNDFDALLGNYEEIEKLALESDKIFLVERLNNLWFLLYTLSFTSDLVDKDSLKKKTKNLKEKLVSMVGNESNPSAAVHSEALLNFMFLAQSKDRPKEINKVFKELKKVISKAENLIGFPFRTTFQVLDEMNDVFSGNEGFEELQEHLVEVVTKREGDVAAGEMLLNRGIQHCKAERFYKAIDFLGRALTRFYKKESKNQLVISLVFLSIAYEEAGLLWAARGALLNAASHATSDFWIYSEINTMQLSCYKRLRVIELLLGRVGYALEWHQLHHIMAAQFVKTKEERRKLLDEDLYFGSLTGLLLIKTPANKLSKLEKLPDTLISMDLDFAAFGLIYRLRGKDGLPESFINRMTKEEVEDFFSSYLIQPAQEQLPNEPLFYEEDTVELKSTILGCDFILNVKNNSPEIEIAEYVLSALESFLSTTIARDASSRDGIVYISVNCDRALGIKITHKINKQGKMNIEIKCGDFNPHSLTVSEQRDIHSDISEIIIQIVGNTVVFKDPEVDLLTLFRDEEVNSRAFSFSSPLVTLGNVLGYQPKRKISDWIEDGSKRFEYSKEKSGILREIPKPKYNKLDVKSKSDALRHDKIKNVSVIRQHLWNDAGWTGALYLTMQDRPPVLAFMYTNEGAAKAIFKDWKETLGDKDENEIIRISMVRGISEKNPTWYRIVVATNLDENSPPEDKIITVFRIHTVTPETTENLDRFMKSFKKWGFYLLAPAFATNVSSPPEIFFDHGIVKRSLTDKHAWEIGPNDPDIAAVMTNDGTTPIIPREVKDAPILKVLKERKLNK